MHQKYEIGKSESMVKYELEKQAWVGEFVHLSTPKLRRLHYPDKPKSHKEKYH